MVDDTNRTSVWYNDRHLYRKWGGSGLTTTVTIAKCFLPQHVTIWRDNLDIQMAIDIATLVE